MAKRKIKRMFDGGSGDDQNEDGSLDKMGGEDSSGFRDDQTSETPTPMPTPKATAPKRVIVTKEQLAASPYDNLRDYLNAQQNLKRRDGSAPSSKSTTSMQDRALGPNTVPKYTPPENKTEPKYKTPFQKQQEDAGEGAKAFKNVISKIFGSKSQRTTAAEKDKAKGMAKGGSISKFAKGGSVSSRGDGIAQRGRTKGHMR